MVERLQIMKREQRHKQGKMLQDVQQKILASLWQEILLADSDNSGHLDMQEMMDLLQRRSVRFKLRCLDIQPGEAGVLFESLGTDGDKGINVETFMTSLPKIRGVATNVDMGRLLGKIVQDLHRSKHNVEMTRNMSERVDVLTELLLSRAAGLRTEIDSRRTDRERGEDLKRNAVRRQNTIEAAQIEQRTTFPQCKMHDDVEDDDELW